MRLDKWLSDATSYTRSQLKQPIRSGQVTVNQTIVKKPETPVQETDVICLQGILLNQRNLAIVCCSISHWVMFVR